MSLDCSQLTSSRAKTKVPDSWETAPRGLLQEGSPVAKFPEDIPRWSDTVKHPAHHKERTWDTHTHETYNVNSLHICCNIYRPVVSVGKLFKQNIPLHSFPVDSQMPLPHQYQNIWLLLTRPVWGGGGMFFCFLCVRVFFNNSKTQKAIPFHCASPSPKNPRSCFKTRWLGHDGFLRLKG